MSAASPCRPILNALNNNLMFADNANIIKTEFGQVTPENSMKVRTYESTTGRVINGPASA